MDQNNTVSGILRDLVMLATESADVRAGTLSEAEYRGHCELVEKRIQEAFPAKE